ncbi:MAG TPA: NAD(P)H-dependent oxidoreductase subunit E, partial [Candidatus Omnitrophota bacterium]|nr:NAD(P)H-dependent oxidoreductase subunit E [Candidatus Omnitrophota bacterium]
MPKKFYITLCDGPACSKKSGGLKSAVEKELARRGLSGDTGIIISGCLGMCDKGPVIVINPGYTVYGNIDEKNIPQIIESHIVNNKPLAKFAISDDHLYNRFFKVFGDVNFFSRQMRIVLRNCGIIDPESIDDYLSVRGYEALAKVLTDLKPKDVVDMVKMAGLRGRGGAGFPTGLKWELTARESSSEKYIICNADEGDPGAFMDRSTIEGDPHTVLEGMIIG